VGTPNTECAAEDGYTNKAHEESSSTSAKKRKTKDDIKGSTARMSLVGVSIDNTQNVNYEMDSNETTGAMDHKTASLFKKRIIIPFVRAYRLHCF
jgi:hypothetical protein